MQYRAMNRGGVVLALGAALLVAGCERGPNLADVVEEQAERLNFVWAGAGGAGMGIHPEVRAATYRDVISSLQRGIERAGGRNEAVTASARTLVAQASIGEAELSVQTMSRGSLAAVQRLSEVTSELNRALSDRALAAGLRAYDPSEDLAELEDAAGAVRVGLRDHRGRLEERRAALESAEAQRQSLMASAREVRVRATEVRDQVGQREGMSRAETITEAVRIGREADAIEKQAAEKGFEIERLIREIGESEADISSGERRLTMIEQAQQQIREKVESARAQSRLMTEEVERSSARARDGLKDVLDIIEERVTPAYEEARGAYQRAIQQARQAGRAGGGSANAALASAEHSLASLAEQYVVLGEVVREIGTEIANLQRFEGAMRSRFDAFVRSVEEAASLRDQSFGSAAEVLSRIGGSEQLERVIERLRERAGTPMPATHDDGMDGMTEPESWDDPGEDPGDYEDDEWDGFSG